MKALSGWVLAKRAQAEAERLALARIHAATREIAERIDALLSDLNESRTAEGRQRRGSLLQSEAIYRQQLEHELQRQHQRQHQARQAAVAQAERAALAERGAETAEDMDQRQVRERQRIKHERERHEIEDIGILRQKGERP